MKSYFLAGVIAVFPMVGMAASFDCTTKNFGRGGWVSKRYIAAYDDGAGAGSMIDAGINEVHGAPIPVDWKRRSDTSSTFRWKLKGANISNAGKAILSYKFTLFESRNEFTLSGRLHGYDNVISASGTCKKIR